MDVYSGTARQTLHLLGAEDTPLPHTKWAQFDASWYRAAYPDTPDGPPEAVLAWHFDHGEARGHAPNQWFDEAWQREAWHAVREPIEAGIVASAFDAWCRGGHFHRPPHWLFDPREYARRYPLLTRERLLEAGLANHYDHFLRFGAREHRVCHALFDPAVYLAGLDPDETEAASGDPVQHYLACSGRGRPERRTSPLFDLEWYAETHDDAVRAVAAGEYRTLLEHYLRNPTPRAFDPSLWFSEAWYLRSNPGLEDAVGPEGFRNGFAHFIAYGRDEGRSPHPDLDLGWYAGQDRVRADVEAGLAEDGYAHWIVIGAAAGWPGRPMDAPDLSFATGAALRRIEAETVATVLGRRKLGFDAEGTPLLSVVMRLGRDAAATARSLASVVAGHHGAIDAVLIATGGLEGDVDIELYVEGATILRFDAELDSAAAREAGIVAAAAEIVLFLDDGMDLAPCAVAAALDRFAATPDIGAVGARIARPHGPLAEAGGIVWRDGRVQAYMADRPPLSAEANFAREVDFCSASCLFVRKSALAGLPPAGPGLTGTTHDAADFCLRLRAAGYRTMYDPGVLAFQRHPPRRLPSGRDAFLRDHSTRLPDRPIRAPEAEIHARRVEHGQRRVLFVEDAVPLRRIGSGFVRSNDIVRAMVAAGIEVTVFPIAASPFPLPLIFAEMPPEVEIMWTSTVADFADFLDARLDHYDTVWVARTHNLDKIHETLTVAAARAARPPRIVLDTEAVAAHREAERAAIMGESFDLAAALDREFRHFTPEMDAVAVTEAEAATLQQRHGRRPMTIGHAMRTEPALTPFLERSGILFAAAFHGMDHPNYDGLAWFADEVLPLIERALRWETRLTVAGYIAPHVTLERFQDHPRVTLRGPVADLRPLYATHRVAIAPMRFAAGVPYKVHEAAAMGLPMVATSLLARQLGWPDGEALSAAEASDAAGFAERVVALYRNPELWMRQRELALARVATELDPERFAAKVVALAGRARAEPAVSADLAEAPMSLNSSSGLYMALPPAGDLPRSWRIE